MVSPDSQAQRARCQAETPLIDLFKIASPALALAGKAPSTMEKPEHRGEVWIRQYSDGLKCDVIVAIGADEMVLQLPDYRAAVKWTQMEAKAHKITARL